MQKIRFLLLFLKYKVFAKHRKGNAVHSPFLFDFITNTLLEKIQYYAFEDIWNIRQDLKQDTRSIQVTDFGAGSKKMGNKCRKITEIAKFSGISEKYGELLFRTVVKYKPLTIVELGTSIGLASLYMAMPNSCATVYTIEGCPETAKIAEENFAEMQVENIRLMVGKIEEKLPELLNKLDKVDLVYFDGNHQYEPTINYFNQCLEKVHNNTIFIFDDIHWSAQMSEAWTQIKLNPMVTLSIDLFFSGYVFFRKELSKQNFIVHF